MKKLTVLVMLVVLFGAAGAAWGKSAYQPEEEIQADAERAFGEILGLWHDKKYDELYDRTLSAGKLTRKSFADKLASARHRPTCCWMMLQEVRVAVKNDDNVVIRAKIGLEGIGDAEYRTGVFKLRRVAGIWRASRSELLSLAGTRKKKRYTNSGN
jgi:hypothetical protein